jgi:hypothetical protein
VAIQLIKRKCMSKTTSPLAPALAAPPGPAVRRFGVICIALSIILSAGCKEEPIDHYQAPKEETPPKPTWTLPKGWDKSDKKVPFSIGVFKVSEEGQEADVTVSWLAGDGGGLLQNVNRWRRQVGLPPIEQDDLLKEVKKVEVGGVPGYSVDLTAPDSAGDKPLRILGEIVPNEKRTWFFKMRGPVGLVEKQKGSFDTFVKSVRFVGGSGAKP